MLQILRWNYSNKKKGTYKIAKQVSVMNEYTKLYQKMRETCIPPLNKTKTVNAIRKARNPITFLVKEILFRPPSR